MDSKEITVTDARLLQALETPISHVMSNSITPQINKVANDLKIKTGRVTKYYQYLDKAEVQLDESNKKVVCRLLHSFGGSIIDLFTPLAEEGTFCDNLKEPCIIPRYALDCAVVPINSDEWLLLGYINKNELVGLNPAKQGNIKISSINDLNQFWIQFGRDGLDIRLPSKLTAEVGKLDENMKKVDYVESDTVYTKEEVDEKIKNNTSSLSSSELLKLVEKYDQRGIDKYYLFRGDCWAINNNYESSAAITSTGPTNLKVEGTFRTHQDLVGLYWYSEDLITHPYISYGNRSDYRDVIFECDVDYRGCLFDYDSPGFSSSFTIEMNDNSIYYLKTSDFITFDPQTGVSHLKIDFNKLEVKANSEYINSKGRTIVTRDSFKLDVSNVKFLMFVLIPPSYETNKTTYTIKENSDYYLEFTNIKVENGDICREHLKLEPHKYRLCEGYDDFYNLNPYRVCKEMRKLGYVEWCDLYIGASHFYEKSGTVGETILVRDEKNKEIFDHSRTEKMVLDTSVPLNKSFRAWLDCYSRELKKNDCPNLVVSVSMENLQCPPDWRQKQSAPSQDPEVREKNPNGYAMTGWIPSTFFYSPCHHEVLPYMQSVSEACLDIVVANQMRPILQLGEAWWWWNEYTDPTYRSPCFYDDATKQKYYDTFGKNLPEYVTPDEEFDTEAIDWLNKQIVDYSWGIREVVKKPKYTDGLYMALFFPPSVLDTDRVPIMIQRVNYLTGIYSRSQLDILQVEDYDWVTGNPLQPETKERDRSHHPQAYIIGEELGFQTNQQHYFGGFVQYPEDASEFWVEIKKAMDDAINKGFAEVYVWAGSQVRRDHKMLGYDEYELAQYWLSTGNTTVTINMGNDEGDPPDIPEGWQTFTKTEKFWNVTDGTALKYRKKGSIVEMNGKVHLHSNDDELTELLLGALPRGFRPLSEQYFPLKGTQSGDSSIIYDWICCVRPTGDVYVLKVKEGNQEIIPFAGNQFTITNDVVWFMA